MSTGVLQHVNSLLKIIWITSRQQILTSFQQPPVYNHCQLSTMCRAGVMPTKGNCYQTLSHDLYINCLLKHCNCKRQHMPSLLASAHSGTHHSTPAPTHPGATHSQPTPPAAQTKLSLAHGNTCCLHCMRRLTNKSSTHTLVQCTITSHLPPHTTTMSVCKRRDAACIAPPHELNMPLTLNICVQATAHAGCMHQIHKLSPAPRFCCNTLSPHTSSGTTPQHMRTSRNTCCFMRRITNSVRRPDPGATYHPPTASLPLLDAPPPTAATPAPHQPAGSHPQRPDAYHNTPTYA